MTATNNQADYPTSLLAFRAANIPVPIAVGAARSVIAFTYGLPDEPSFPAQALAQAAAEVMQTQAAEALQYNSPRPLAQYLVETINADQGMQISLENLLVTAGSSQALSLVCRLLIDPGDYIVVEGPTFLGAVRTFRTAEAQIAEVPVDDDGMIIEELDKTLTELAGAGKRVKFVYTIPTFQNPMGVTMGLERRKQMLEVAARHEVLLLEDDAYHGLLYEGEVPPWLWALDTQGIVLHCGTFSKTLAAGMRLGWVGGRPELVAKIAALKDDGGTSPFAGYIAAKFAENGRLERHKQVLIDIYRRKRDRMLAGLERYMPDGARWTNPQGGFFIWLELPERVDTVKILKKAIEAGVNYLPGPACFASGKGRNTIRLAFSFVALEQIEPGLRILGEVIGQELSQ